MPVTCRKPKQSLRIPRICSRDEKQGTKGEIVGANLIISQLAVDIRNKNSFLQTPPSGITSGEKY
jgi:hypothetical protein